MLTDMASLCAVQLLHKLSIRAVSGTEKLLKVIKNPITDHLPPNCRKISNITLWHSWLDTVSSNYGE